MNNCIGVLTLYIIVVYVIVCIGCILIALVNNNNDRG